VLAANYKCGVFLGSKNQLERAFEAIEHPPTSCEALSSRVEGLVAALTSALPIVGIGRLSIWGCAYEDLKAEFMKVALLV
jgi:hypothetical protein